MAPEQQSEYWDDIVGNNWPEISPGTWSSMGTTARDAVALIDGLAAPQAAQNFSDTIPYSALITTVKDNMASLQDDPQAFIDALTLASGVFGKFADLVRKLRNQILDIVADAIEDIAHCTTHHEGRHKQAIIEDAARQVDDAAKAALNAISSPQTFPYLDPIANALGRPPYAWPPSVEPTRDPGAPIYENEKGKTVPDQQDQQGTGDPKPVVPVVDPIVNPPGIPGIYDPTKLGTDLVLPDDKGAPPTNQFPNDKSNTMPLTPVGETGHDTTANGPAAANPTHGGQTVVVQQPGGTGGDAGGDGGSGGHTDDGGMTQPSPAESTTAETSGPPGGASARPDKDDEVKLDEATVVDLKSETTDTTTHHPTQPAVASAQLINEPDKPAVEQPEGAAAMLPPPGASGAGAAAGGAAPPTTLLPQPVASGPEHARPAAAPAAAASVVGVTAPAAAPAPSTHTQTHQQQAAQIRDVVGAAMAAAAAPNFVLGDKVDGDLVLARTVLGGILAAVDSAVVGLDWAVSVMRGPGGLGIFVTSNEGRGWMPAGLYLPWQVSVPWVWEVSDGGGVAWEGVADPARVLVEFGVALGARSGARLSAVAASGEIEPIMRSKFSEVSMEGSVEASDKLNLSMPSPNVVDRLGVVSAPELLERVDATPEENVTSRCSELASDAHARLARVGSGLSEAAEVRGLRERILSVVAQGGEVQPEWWEELHDADDMLAVGMMTRRADVKHVDIGQLRPSKEGSDAAALRELVFERRCDELVLLLQTPANRQLLRDITYAHAHIVDHPLFPATPIPDAPAKPTRARVTAPLS